MNPRSNTLALLVLLVLGCSGGGRTPTSGTKGTGGQHVGTGGTRSTAQAGAGSPGHAGTGTSPDGGSKSDAGGPNKGMGSTGGGGTGDGTGGAGPVIDIELRNQPVIALYDADHILMSGVCGHLHSLVFEGLCVVEFDLDGNQIWYKSYLNIDPNDSETNLISMIVSPLDHSIYISGIHAGAFLKKLDSMGNLLWNNQLPEHQSGRLSTRSNLASIVSIDSDGNTYLSDPFAITKYDKDGKQIWAIPMVQGTSDPSSPNPNEIDLDPIVSGDSLGNTYAVARMFGKEGTSIYKYNSSGTLVWTSKPLPASACSSYLTSRGVLTVAPDGTSIYGGGITCVAKYDMDGNEVWVTPTNGGGYVATVSSNGSAIYIADDAMYPANVARYDQHGNLVWSISRSRSNGKLVLAEEKGRLFSTWCCGGKLYLESHSTADGSLLEEL
jgi:hypothetical protein